LQDVAGLSLADKMPKFRGHFCLAFQDITNKG